MSKYVTDYLEKYEAALVLVDYGSPDKRRDVAFAMIWLMVEERSLTRTIKHDILLALAERVFKNESLLDNLTQAVSESTVLMFNYSPFSHLLIKLSASGLLNMDTVQHIFDHLNTEYKKYSGGSCMQDSVYNVPFYGFNCAALNRCLLAAKPT
ncbi:hypothetical protein CLV44_10164 [Marinobacterium halophilum]|uniref:Uncharacterized protein n=1 Tax=Marinobacterium halophilum TaxID=267374 RepID=A0A2P8F4N9_9GAMM|nr:hypothetical protein [Marinobacterium halophilum]PSL16666.1 hypothetical protein CLV44_10164 [Marinobacterium halophilum]